MWKTTNETVTTNNNLVDGVPNPDVISIVSEPDVICDVSAVENGHVGDDLNDDVNDDVDDDVFYPNGSDAWEPPEHSHVAGLCYVDFVPQDGHLLKDLISWANDYLSENLAYHPVSCEAIVTGDRVTSAKRQANDRSADFQRSFYDERVSSDANYSKVLRLWMLPEEEGLLEEVAETPMLDYITWVPKCVHQGGKFTSPEYQGLDSAFTDLSEFIKQGGLKGSIINIQTDEIRADYIRDQNINTEKVFWMENPTTTQYLTVIRVFYIKGPATYPAIGYQDFCPYHRYEETWETLPDMLPDSERWLQQEGQQGKFVTNVQTVEVKLGFTWLDGEAYPSKEVTSDRTLFVNETSASINTVKILRYYWKESETKHNISQVTMESFHPGITLKAKLPEFKDQTYNFTRLSAYLYHLNPRLLGVETVGYKTEPKLEANVNQANHTKQEGDIHRRVYIFRIHLVGNYTLPPEDILPPLSDAPVKSESCIIL